MADVLLLHYSHQVGERAVDGVLLESVTLLDALAHEALATFLGQGRDGLMFDFVDLFGEGEFSHAILQTSLAKIDTSSEGARILSVEEE